MCLRSTNDRSVEEQQLGLLREQLAVLTKEIYGIWELESGGMMRSFVFYRIRFLEKRGALQTLLALLGGSLPLIELKKQVNCSGTALYSAIEDLMKLGLIKEEREDAFPRRRILTLTDKGRKIANALAQIEEELRKLIP